MSYSNNDENHYLMSNQKYLCTLRISGDTKIVIDTTKLLFWQKNIIILIALFLSSMFKQRNMVK